MGSLTLDGLPHVMLYDGDGNFTILGKAVNMSTETDFDHCTNSVKLDFDLRFNYWGNIPCDNEFHPEASPEHEMARKAAMNMIFGDHTNTFPADDPGYDASGHKTIFGVDCTPARYEMEINPVDIGINYIKTKANFDIKGTVYDLYGLEKPVSFDVKEVIYNDPAVIVYWMDGTKTVATAQNEEYDPEKGLAICFAKKALGNNYKGMVRFKRLLKKAYKKKPEEDCTLVVKPKVTSVTIEAEVEKKPKTRRSSKKTTE